MLSALHFDVCISFLTDYVSVFTVRAVFWHRWLAGFEGEEGGAVSEEGSRPVGFGH